MKMARGVAAGIVALAMIGSPDANAWFFFFIPGRVIDKIGDTLSGAKGDNCVAATAKVGDVITSPAGNTATIKSLSGTWDRCKEPKLPVRALLEFNYSFSSKAGIDLPDGFRQKDLSATQRFNGILLSVIDEQRTIGLLIFARPRKPGSDGAALAHTVSKSLINAIEDGKAINPEELRINGMRAYRFQVTGKNKGAFGRSFTYLVTVLEGDTEYVVLNANCRTDDFGQYQEVLKQFAHEVRGIATDPAGTHTSSAGDAREMEPAGPASEAQKATATSPPNGPSPDVAGEAIADRLRTLDKLRKEGLISEKDYEAKKQELLKGL